MGRLSKLLAGIFSRKGSPVEPQTQAAAGKAGGLEWVQGFPFNDLHSFKDYVTFVGMCAPDRFPFREGRPAEEQWTLDLAYKGLEVGLNHSIQEKGNRPQFQRVRQLFDEAHRHYRMGDRVSGAKVLEEARKLLREVPSQ